MASRETLFSGSAFRIGKSGDQDGVNSLVVFLVGLVFVSFEIGGERAFGNGLGGIPRGMALSNEQSEVLDRASLQIPEGGASKFAKHRSIPLFAFPCSNKEQPCGLETRRRVNQGELEHLAGQLAALGKFA